jgi:hypothetical protein
LLQIRMTRTNTIKLFYNFNLPNDCHKLPRVPLKGLFVGTWTLNNDIQHKDTQNNDTEQHDIQHNDIQNNESQHIDIQCNSKKMQHSA